MRKRSRRLAANLLILPWLIYAGYAAAGAAIGVGSAVIATNTVKIIEAKMEESETQDVYTYGDAGQEFPDLSVDG